MIHHHKRSHDLSINQSASSAALFLVCLPVTPIIQDQRSNINRGSNRISQKQKGWIVFVFDTQTVIWSEAGDEMFGASFCGRVYTQVLRQLVHSLHQHLWHHQPEITRTDNVESLTQKPKMLCLKQECETATTHDHQKLRYQECLINQ